MAAKYVTCPAGHRNDRVGGRRKCADCGLPLRKRRVPKHAATLRDDSYAVYAKVNADIHGITDESCACCGRPRLDNHHERDHGHKREELSFGKPRGLLCHYCNKYVLANRTLVELRAATAYLERVEAHYSLPQRLA